ncbi:hypothetical protein BDF14DRAFT_1685011, partial [Spinellus fusiger]
CGNPLLRDWIGEWMEKARDQQSKAYFTYKKAHDSISKCPIVFQHPSEADQLHGIGAGMVAKLEKKMTEHCVAHRLPLPARTKGKKRTAVDSQEHSHHDNPCETSANKKPRQPRPPRIYVPTYRSGAYAILLSLLEYQENNQDQVTKEQIIRSAQNYCNTSFDLPPSGKNYTAWNSIKTLIEKSYVWKHGSPARYMLTEEGAAMALQLRNACLPSQTTHSKRRKTGPSHEEGEGGDSGNEEEEEETLSRSYSATPTIEEREKGEGEGFDPFPPTTYDIVLVLDSREIKMRSNRDYIQERLVEKGVRVITRALDLGDVIWIAQKCGTESPGEGLFLDIVLERKRLDDLVSSIKDGRFKEQKRRLGQAGARKVMYVVEEHNKEEAARFGIQAIHAAMSGTQIMDGFYLKRTQSLDDTIDYLVCVTALVRKMYKGMTLYRIPEHLVSRNNYLALKTRLGQQQKEKANAYYVISYPLYNQLNSKHGTATLKDLYLRMLRVLRGVSGEKATAFAQIYPTPHSLLSAFDEKRNDRKAAQMMARDATEDSFMRRKWSTSLSKRLWETWGSN